MLYKLLEKYYLPEKCKILLSIMQKQRYALLVYYIAIPHFHIFHIFSTSDLASDSLIFPNISVENSMEYIIYVYSQIHNYAATAAASRY